MTGSKTKRIIGTLAPMVKYKTIRFRRFNEILNGADGFTYVALPCPYQRYHIELCMQVDGFTDRGASGMDDGVDALQMAIRVSGRARGHRIEQEDRNKVIMTNMEKAGMTVDRSTIPKSCWTAEMKDDEEREMAMAFSGGGEDCGELWENSIYGD